MNTLSIIFNTCGIKRENSHQYIVGLKSLLDQTLTNTRIIMSGCLHSDYTKQQLQKEFGNSISYNFIDEKLPVNITFNHSVLQACKTFGVFDGYLFVDSGIILNNITDLEILYSLFKSDSYGMVTTQVDTDAGYLHWFGVGKSYNDHSENYKFFQNGDFIIPVGKALNLHCQIFSNKLLEYYGYLIPDIFAGFCTESVFSFVCAALNTKWVLSKDVMVSHIHSLDYGSAGFDPNIWVKETGRPNWDHPFLVESLIPIMQEGYKYGLGYEEWQHIMPHNPIHYDVNGYCTNNLLKDFIKNNLYIGNIGLLNYDNIKHTWIQ